jgi:hypothetical protein
MKQITINGNSYKAKLNIRAAKTFEEQTGKDISQVSTITDMASLVYACVHAAAIAEKKDCPLTMDDIVDGVELDELSSIVEQIAPSGQGE